MVYICTPEKQQEVFVFFSVGRNCFAECFNCNFKLPVSECGSQRSYSSINYITRDVFPAQAFNEFFFFIHVMADDFCITDEITFRIEFEITIAVDNSLSENNGRDMSFTNCTKAENNPSCSGFKSALVGCFHDTWIKKCG